MCLTSKALFFLANESDVVYTCTKIVSVGMKQPFHGSDFCFVVLYVLDKLELVRMINICENQGGYGVMNKSLVQILLCTVFVMLGVFLVITGINGNAENSRL